MTQQQAANMLKLQYLIKLTILDYSNISKLSSFNIEWAIECLALSKGNTVILPKKIKSSDRNYCSDYRGRQTHSP